MEMWGAGTGGVPDPRSADSCLFQEPRLDSRRDNILQLTNPHTSENPACWALPSPQWPCDQQCQMGPLRPNGQETDVKRRGVLRKSG